MTFEAERRQLKQYIEKFDTVEFSSLASVLTVKAQDVEFYQQQIARFKAKLERKRKMAQSFKQTLKRDVIPEDSTVLITQEQIDVLLAKAGL